MRKIVHSLTLAGTLLFSVSAVHATVIMQTLPEFSFDGGPSFPAPEQVVGTFNFVIPAGEVIISASLAGAFGNTASGSSAAQDVFADGALVAQCPGEGFACDTSIVSWMFNFVGFSGLEDGMLVLSQIQLAEAVTRLGETKLTIETTGGVVPEPTTLLLLGLGLAGLGFARRRLY